MNDETEEESSFFDENPLFSDLLIISLPGMAVTMAWMIFQASLVSALLQGLFTSLVFLAGLIYLGKKYNTSAFRVIDK